VGPSPTATKDIKGGRLRVRRKKREDTPSFQKGKESTNRRKKRKNSAALGGRTERTTSNEWTLSSVTKKLLERSILGRKDRTSDREGKLKGRAHQIGVVEQSYQLHKQRLLPLRKSKNIL